MRVCRFLLVVAFLGLGVAACNRPSPATISECRAGQKWLSLSEKDFERCLRESEYRKDVEAKSDMRFADVYTRDHNEGREVLEPRGYDLSTFSRIERMSQLSGTVLGLGEKAEAQRGKRYVISGTASVLPLSGPNEALSVFIYGTGDRPEDRGFQMVRTDALNGYQKQFLLDHCVLSEGTSLCEGQVYLEIRKDPRLPTVSPQMVGAQFKEGLAQRIFEKHQETRRLAEAARPKSSR
jgi:hypothetical protein